MKIGRLGGRIDHWRQWLESTRPPRVACEVAADGVAAVRRARASLNIEAWSAKSLPEGVVRPGPLADNVLNPGALEGVLRELLGQVAIGEKRVAVILPDAVARLWLLPVEKLPEKRAEAAAMLRWRLAREVAFDLEQTLLAYQVFPRAEAGAEVLVAAAQRAFLRQYEERFEALGFEPAWVTLATLATLGWLEPEPPACRMLARRDPSSLGLAIVRGNDLRFVRSLPAILADGSAEALFDQIYPSLVYYQDHWGEPVTQALLVGMGEARAELARLLHREAGCLAVELTLESWVGQPPPGTRLPDRSLAAALGFLRAGVQP